MLKHQRLHGNTKIHSVPLFCEWESSTLVVICSMLAIMGKRFGDAGLRDVAV